MIKVDATDEGIIHGMNDHRLKRSRSLGISVYHTSKDK